MDNKIVTIDQLGGILDIVQKDILIQQQTHKIINTKEPMNDDIPLVFINGNLPTSKKSVQCKLEYLSKTKQFHSYVEIKLHGTSSLKHQKKNYNIRLYSDKYCSKKLNINFRHWGAHNTFCLKANYIDSTHSRNIVCARLWDKIVKSRSDYDSLPEELKNSPNSGAVDGFVIRVFLNDEYAGLYTWNIPKSEWQLGMSKNEEKHVLLCAEINDNGEPGKQINPCNFNSGWSGIDGEGFSVINGKINLDVVYAFGKLATDAIEGRIGKDDRTPNFPWIDFQNVIDYFIFQEVIAGIDGLAKNMLVGTYDLECWYLTPYDMDSTFKLYWDGNLSVPSDISMPEGYENVYSQLLHVIFNDSGYFSKYQERYKELRKSALSYASIMSEFDRFIGIINQNIYEVDNSIWNLPNSAARQLYDIASFLKERLENLDKKYGV